MKVNEVLSLSVSDIALGGRAIARHGSLVVQLDRGLPGDRVRARLSRMRRNFAEARLESVEMESDLRVPAPCPHVQHCGGCRLQEMAYSAQLTLKERQVRETVARLGGIADPPVRPIVPAPQTFGYRNKMEFSFHPGEGGPLLGLHERGTFDRVFDLETCLLPSPLTVEIVKRTQSFAREHQWSAYHPGRHQGVVRFLTVRHLANTAQCGVHLVAASDRIPALEAWAETVAALSEQIRTVSLVINETRANVATGDHERILHGDGLVVERLLGLEFEASSRAFLQTNSRQAEALYETVLEAARLEPGDAALDLYSGAGTLTLLLGRQAREAVGVESVGAAAAAARRNAERNRIANVRFVEGEARPLLRAWARGERPDGVKPDVVVVDPPRAGLHPRVVFRVAELRPRAVVYVSCNPATLARDLRDFATHGYGVEEVRPFDMFPHTPHIECVSRLAPIG